MNNAVGNDDSSGLKPSAHVARIVKILEKFYGVTGLLMIPVLSLLLGGFSVGSIDFEKRGWEVVYGLFYLALAYYGLGQRKNWVLNLLLYISALGLIGSFGPAETVAALIAKPLAFGLSVFQLWFFTKPQTRHFFNETASTLF